MAEEGEDAVATLGAPEMLTEEEQEELRRELTKVRDRVCGPRTLPCGFAEAPYGKRLKAKESLHSPESQRTKEMK